MALRNGANQGHAGCLGAKPKGWPVEGTTMKTSFMKAGASSLALAVSLLAATGSLAQTAPKYEADLSWPKPLPDKWVIGGLGGLCVDAQDHVLILNRQDVLDVDLNAGKLAPQMIEFDAAGNVVNSWGDPKLLDPRLHSCHFDKEGNVWVAAAPSGMVQKYTHDGKSLLLTIGKKGELDSSDGSEKGKPLNSPAAKFFMPSSIYVDRGNGDVYVSDGEGAKSNRRVAVMDKTGKFLRQWVIDDMETVHCLTMANDGTVYVCNRLGSGIRLYDKMGKLQKTIAVPWTPVTPPKDGKPKETGGSAVAIDFSPDPQQRLIFVINQNNSDIEIIERQTGKKLGSFGRAGSFAGELNQPHGIAVDSKGNVYIAENRGRRVHKFKPVGS
jgi:sugar lactone lactonase YvrE